MTLLDSVRLVRFLHHGEDTSRSLLVQAVYAGLATRVTRGDFDHHDTVLTVGGEAEDRA